MVGDKSWCLLLNTEKAGSAWVGSVLAEHFDVVFRHNKRSLLEKQSIWGITVHDEKFLAGCERIFHDEEAASVASHFAHLEYNVDGGIYGMADAYNALRYIVNRFKFPAQNSQLKDRKFKVGNLILHPVRLVDSVFRMWLAHSRADPGRGWMIDYDDVLAAILLENFKNPSDEDIIFVCCVLYVVNAVTRDIVLCKVFGIKCIPFERLRDNPDYLGKFIEAFVRPLVPEERHRLQSICENGRFHKRSIREMRDVKEEVDAIIKDMSAERRHCLNICFYVFNVRGIFGGAYDLGVSDCDPSKFGLSSYNPGKIHLSFLRSAEAVLPAPIGVIKKIMESGG